MESKYFRLHNILSELNIGLDTANDFLRKCHHLGYAENLELNSKISFETRKLLFQEFNADAIEIAKAREIWDHLKELSESETKSFIHKEETTLIHNCYLFEELFNKIYVLDTNICIKAPTLIHDICNLHMRINYLLKQVRQQLRGEPKFVVPKTVLEELDRKKCDMSLKANIKKFLAYKSSGNANIVYPSIERKMIPMEWKLNKADNRILNTAVEYKGVLLTDDVILQEKAQSIDVPFCSLDEIERSLNSVRKVLHDYKANYSL